MLVMSCHITRPDPVILARVAALPRRTGTSETSKVRVIFTSLYLLHLSTIHLMFIYERDKYKLKLVEPMTEDSLL